MKVFEVMAQAFIDENVDTVFSLMGDANLFWLSALLARSDVLNVHARHEGAALAMADGYARSTGKVGVATVTSGPGLTQATTALIGASRYRVPMVVFAGDTAVGDTTSTQRLDHRAFAALCGVPICEVTSPGDCLDRVQQAFYVARATRQPVLLSVPLDIQDMEYDATMAYVPSDRLLATPSPLVPGATDLDRAAGLIMSSRRPVILVGSGGVHPESLLAIEELGDRIGALYATSLLAKGAFDHSPWTVGIAGTFSDATATEVLADADLVIGVGASLNDYTSLQGHLYPNARTLQIADEPRSKVSPRRFVDCYLQGDSRATIQALVQMLEEADYTSPGMRSRLAAVEASNERSRDKNRSPADGMDPREVVDVLDRAIPDGAIVVCGAGHFWSFVVRGLTRGSGRRYLFTLGFASIGQALPVAVGAAIGNPETPVIAVEGDTSILVHPQELDTAVRHGLSVLAFVLDDDAMGAEAHKLSAHELPPDPALVPTPDLELMARAFGATGTVVRDISDLRSVLGKYDWESVHLIDVKITREVVDLEALKQLPARRMPG